MAYKAALLIQGKGGLARVMKYKSYGSPSFRLYANANAQNAAYDVINEIAHKGKKWSDW